MDVRVVLASLSKWSPRAPGGGSHAASVCTAHAPSGDGNTNKLFIR